MNVTEFHDEIYKILVLLKDGEKIVDIGNADLVLKIKFNNEQEKSTIDHFIKMLADNNIFPCLITESKNFKKNDSNIIYDENKK